ncbi:Fasciclin-like arabinogalactan protein 7 [Vitis vinifera]|uniref:Fasciclin-like arabinogalactan protein 7 n=1 Tax=Vitis vinifera TaxID=29760 RepID=A0A438ILB8_VITVI|nr:Fasciclin-like arabinogalactan protein 7 [Vitis vinifera]
MGEANTLWRKIWDACRDGSLIWFGSNRGWFWFLQEFGESGHSYAQMVGSPSLSPSPAPAPAPPYVNLTDLLSVADDAFKSLKKPSLSNLTEDQLKSLLLFHALAHYYSLADFKNLSQLSPVSTFAGGQYTLNFTDVSGTVHIGSGWTNTKVSSSVHSTDPVAVYQVDKVLLPEAIFGTDIPPTPAPAPAPDISPAADAPTASDEAGSPRASSTPSSSYRIISLGVWSQMVLAISGGLVLFL